MYDLYVDPVKGIPAIESSLPWEQSRHWNCRQEKNENFRGVNSNYTILQRLHVLQWDYTCCMRSVMETLQCLS